MNKRMKTLGRLLAAVTSLAILLSMTAFAEGKESSKESSSTSTTETTKPGEEADSGEGGTGGGDTNGNNNVDEGVKAVTPHLMAYAVTNAAGGEVTKVEKGDRVNIVLTVVDSEAPQDLKASQIAARVNNAAFTYTGLGEASNVDTDAHTYTLLFRDVIYNGGDNNFTVDISYIGHGMAQGSVSHAMGQCVTTTKDNSRTPSILVRGNKITTTVQGAAAGTALAGNECTLTLDLLSTSGDEALTDLLVTLALPEGVTLASGNSTAYIGSMAAGSSTSVSFQLLPGANFTGGVATIGVSLSAVGKDTGAAVSSSTNVTVPVVQPERFELTNLEAPETLYLGEEGYVSLTFVNKGKSSINNLSAEISGENIANPGQSQYLGNIAAGTENSVDFNVQASDAGTLKGTITLSYEDDQGNVKTMTKDFSCDVQEMPNYNDGMDDFDPGIVEPEKTGLPIWAKALIGVAVVAVIAGVVVFIRKKRKEKALGTLEDEDEDI